MSLKIHTHPEIKKTATRALIHAGQKCHLFNPCHCHPYLVVAWMDWKLVRSTMDPEENAIMGTILLCPYMSLNQMCIYTTRGFYDGRKNCFDFPCCLLRHGFVRRIHCLAKKGKARTYFPRFNFLQKGQEQHSSPRKNGNLWSTGSSSCTNTS